MAEVTTIWFCADFTKPDNMKIEVLIHGMKQTIDVTLPPDFKRVVQGIAQAAADNLEKQLSAKLLTGDKATKSGGMGGE